MESPVQVHLRLPAVAAGAVEELLWSLDPGAVSLSETGDESELTAILPATVAAGLETRVAAFLEASGIDLPFSLRSEPYHDRDWQEAFRQEFAPVTIGERLVVAPTWWDGPLPAGKIRLRIDPQMAFGTGHHATTYACLAWLVERAAKGGAKGGANPGGLIDAGCGSGVLAIAAHHLGFAPVTAIDNDPIACATARRNATANGAEPVEVVHGDLATTPLTPAPTVIANLTASAILTLLPTLLGLVAGGGGRLFLAGILAEREAEVTAALGDAGWQVEGRLERNGWVALAGRVIRRSTQINTDLLR